jgi:acylphosphatase
MVCKRVYYSGRVQGVGFRYTTESLANNFTIGGYVKNLPNGDVEVVAEGTADQVDAFLDAISRRMEHYIKHATVTDVPTAGYGDFSIRY